MILYMENPKITHTHTHTLTHTHTVTHTHTHTHTHTQMLELINKFNKISGHKVKKQN